MHILRICAATRYRNSWMKNALLPLPMWRRSSAIPSPMGQGWKCGWVIRPGLWIILCAWIRTMSPVSSASGMKSTTRIISGAGRFLLVSLLIHLITRKKRRMNRNTPLRKTIMCSGRKSLLFLPWERSSGIRCCLPLPEKNERPGSGDSLTGCSLHCPRMRRLSKSVPCRPVVSWIFSGWW